MSRFLVVVAFAIGLAACGAVTTMTEGFKRAQAVESDLEEATGVRPRVGFNWPNNRLVSVTVAFPRVYDAKPLRELADLVREAVQDRFAQPPDNIVLAFSLGTSKSGTTADVRGISSEPPG
jgi:hypothetical protein